MIKKYWKTAVIGLAVVAALIAGILFLQNNFTVPENDTPEDDYDVSHDYDREGVVIYSIPNDSLLKKVTVKNADDEYSVILDDAGVVRIEGMERVTLLPASSAGLYNCPLEIRVESTIELSSQHLEYYGLDEPQATMTVVKETGTDVFCLGDKTPDGGGYYFRNSANNNVYVVSTYLAKRLIGNRTRLISLDIHTVYDYTVNGYTSLAIDRPGDADDVYARYCTQEEISSKKYESVVVLEKPLIFGANSEHVATSVKSLFGITANSAVCYNVTEEALSQYGFDNEIVIDARVIVDISLPLINNVTNPHYDSTAAEGQTAEFTDRYYLGAHDDHAGIYYVMYNNRDVIYSVDDDAFSFLSNDFSYYCQTLLCVVYLNTLKDITIDIGKDESYSIAVSTSKDENNNTLFYGEYQHVAVDSQSMQNLYKYIVGTSQTGLCNEPEGYEPVLTVRLTKITGETSVMEFIPFDEDMLYYFVRVNGEGHFKVISTSAENIISGIRKLINGEDVSYNY